MTATATMTPAQAQEFRAARDAEALRLSRMSKRDLVTAYQSQGGFGGDAWSKDDLTGSLLEWRYPVDRLNEVIHVLYHNGAVWDACGHCTATAVAS